MDTWPLHRRVEKWVGFSTKFASVPWNLNFPFMGTSPVPQVTISSLEPKSLHLLTHH